MAYHKVALITSYHESEFTEQLAERLDEGYQIEHIQRDKEVWSAVLVKRPHRTEPLRPRYT